jgi:hypothetical protein
MRTVGSFEYGNGFILEANTFLSDTSGNSRERRLSWYSDFANYFYVRYDQIVEQLVCICVVNEQWVFYETADVDASEWNGSDQEWHKLTIQLLEDQIMVFRDDDLIFEHIDPALSDMPATGHIRLSNTYQETCFDDVILTSLEGQTYTCGDANGDGAVNVSDAVHIINYVFIGGAAPDPLASGDTNCDLSVNISDAAYIINYVFIGGTQPCDLNGDDIPDC